MKSSVYEKRTIRIFPKGLVHRFGQKFHISSTLIFMNNRQGKSIWERFYNRFYNPLKPPETRCNPQYSHVTNRENENVKVKRKGFSTIYIENRPFCTMKRSVSKTQRIRIFPSGLVHGFAQEY